MLTDVPGVKVGHYTDTENLTGCTVVLPPSGTVASCEWRGGAPGDREWVLLQPEQRVDALHALIFSGGSAFGLATADGVVDWLAERDIGWDVAGLVRVPIVAGAILFDLGLGDPAVRPGPREGRLACDAASDGPFERGNVGAGTGCTVGKAHGREWAMKSGIGTAAIDIDGLIISALVAANPVGNVIDEKGAPLAGSRAPVGTPMVEFTPIENTLLGVVATNATLTKPQAHLLSMAGQDGIAAVVRPPHTRYDGDVVFGLGTCQFDAPVDRVLALASEVIARAVRDAVRSAGSAGGLPGLAG